MKTLKQVQLKKVYLLTMIENIRFTRYQPSYVAISEHQVIRTFARNKGSLTRAMGKCLWFPVKMKICQSALSSH